MPNMAEKLILLSLQNESGKTFSRATYLKRYGLSSALLYELISRKKIEVQGKKLFIIDESSTGDPILDRAFEEIKNAKTLNKWIYSFVRFKASIRKEILYNFIDNGIVREDEKRFLGFIPLKRYPVINDKDKRIAEQQVRDVLLDGKNEEISLIFMSSIIVACKAQSLILTKAEIKTISDKLKLIAKGKYYTTNDDLLPNTIKAIHSAIAAESSAGT
ncbi:GOLPH3/VPS74 family protein [Pseudobacteroides cellulosolvens]|uniref:Golgi phosphoprotein 3 n=1 Tax=Pseudobacteroides cellulosolvens ATCC 35603 = DSM 2933 TaxID=398512 RepID=A0A0L6JR97_9FIRM|nr:GPP34 family phosphoprotein [Pseudobacteroides cellulosolvens]KNY28303.1 Golgi phosphoprotein 3 [Pseudobacteroides cellulosolvens ATCC 35603 = DSM 2933]